ncbi:MAG: flagellar export chaperone FlgN [Desulfuromonadales bacterium]
MNTLTTALDSHLQLLQELLSLLKRETGELSEVHLDAMSEINNLKEEIAARILAGAGSLRRVVEEAATREGFTSKATLGELAVNLNRKGNQDVTRLHAELNATASQVKERLALNRDIAERFVASVGNSLDFLARVINQTNTYGSSGGYQQRLTGAVMINREA